MENGSFLTRRSFLGIAGGLPLAWAAASRLRAASGRKIPIAVQLYSVRGDCKQDFDAALEQVAAMGFAGVEFAGYYNYAASGPELQEAARRPEPQGGRDAHRSWPRCRATR